VFDFKEVICFDKDYFLELNFYTQFDVHGLLKTFVTGRCF